MNLDILANGAPPPWRRKNDGKDSEKGSGPPSGGAGENHQVAVTGYAILTIEQIC